MAHEVIAGIKGVVNGVDTVRQWGISLGNELQAYVASNTKGGTGRVEGNNDWSGSYGAYGHTPAQMPGGTFTFLGEIGGGTTPNFTQATGSALVDSVEITIPIEEGGIISHVVNFSSNGALTFPTGTITDAVVPNPPPSIGTKIESAELIATPVFTEIQDVRSVTITITASNPSYASSGTAGETKRVAGNIDCSVSFTQYEADWTLHPAPGVKKELKVFVDATTFWHFKWVEFGELSDLQVNRETADIIGATHNASMAGYANVPPTPTATEGFIKKPDASTFWPA